MSVESQKRGEDHGAEQGNSDVEAPEATRSGEKVEDSRPIVDLRIEELHKELEKERQKNADLSKRNLYLQSDYLNLQRQTERRIAEAIDDSRIRYIVELISVKEDLERAMSVARANSQNTITDGLRMLLSRVDGILRADEVERIAISSDGKFDPRLHEAVAYTEGNDKKDGTVVSVVGNGYTLRGKVIKPALVEVSRENKATAKTPEDQESEEDFRVEMEADAAGKDGKNDDNDLDVGGPNERAAEEEEKNTS